MKPNPSKNILLPVSEEDSKTNFFIKAFFKVALACFIAATISLLIYLDTHYDTGFNERSFTEFGQEIILVLCVIIYLIIAYKYPKARGFSLFMAFVAGFAFIREFNNSLRVIDHLGGWKLPFFILLIVFPFVLYKNRHTFLNPLKRFINNSEFAYSLSGFVIVFIFSRIFGKKIIWENIFQVDKLEGHFRVVKNAVEEGTELIGYGIILLGAIQYAISIIYLRSQDKNK